MSNISFIVPVYNQEKDIENFLNTICAVNIPDIEKYVLMTAPQTKPVSCLTGLPKKTIE